MNAHGDIIKNAQQAITDRPSPTGHHRQAITDALFAARETFIGPNRESSD
jgi:hypothetical protein